jgi:hypothetical protein
MINSNKWILFVIFLLVGTFVCFFGRKLFKPILFIAGILAGFGLVWLICYNTFLSSYTQNWAFWVVFAVSAIIGLLIGWLLVKLTKVGAFAIAAWGGYSLGLLLYPTFLYKVWSGAAAVWVFSIGFALIAGILALFLFEHVLILSTSLAGSFLAIQGIGLVAGGYQNPFTIASLMEQGVMTSIDPVFYAYLAGNLVLWVLGAVV